MIRAQAATPDEAEPGQAGRTIALHHPLLLRLTTRPEIIASILLLVLSGFLMAATPTFATQENILWVLYSFCSDRHREHRHAAGFADRRYRLFDRLGDRAGGDHCGPDCLLPP